jgi:hypothetical protein
MLDIMRGRARAGLTNMEEPMVKRRGDTTPDPSGGRAAERKKMFEQARGLTAPQPPPRKPGAAKAKKSKTDAAAKQGETSRAQQDRRKD